MFGFQPMFFNHNSGPSGCAPGDDVDFTAAGSSLSQDAYVGFSFSFDLNSLNSGGPAVLWGLSSLPPGLSLNTVTGIITGTPTTDGFYSMTVSAKAACSLDFVTETFSINVYP